MAGKLHLIGYDIADNRSRRRALRLLRPWSFGYQDSVFEVEASDAQLQILLEKLTDLLHPEEDRLFWVQLHSGSACWQLGTGEMTPTGNLLLID